MNAFDNIGQDRPAQDRPEVPAEQPTQETRTGTESGWTPGPNAPEPETPAADHSHELPADIVKDGGVTLADYFANTDTKTVEGITVPELAFAATGTKTAEGDVSDAARAQRALRLDESIRGFASWLQSRPVDERMEMTARPVITVPGE